METVIAITPAYCLDPQIAIAARKAGGLGILDLGWKNDAASISAAITKLREMGGAAGRWGVRWDAFGKRPGGPGRIAEFLECQAEVLILAGLNLDELEKSRKPAKRLARQVFVEVCDRDAALAAQAAGYDGLIVKGHEAGGWIGKSSSFILLQELRGQIEIPYWMQGGIGMHSAAAAVLAGASGVVLAEQLWFTEEGPWFSPEQKLSSFDGSETLAVGLDSELFRLSNRHGRGKLRELELAVARGDDWRELLKQRLLDGVDPLIPIGQEIAFAAGFGRRYGTTGRVITALRDGIDSFLGQARTENLLAPDAPLAKLHGTRFPVVQGPMTRVSDVAPFAKAVAQAGGLPFLALAVMRGPQVRALLAETKELMDQRPWGVGILGFMPLDLRQEQMEAIREVKPPFAIIAGGRPSQARELEALNVSTYLHVPSPGLLEGFIKEGARKFVFEGSECGGHTGPRTSFILWESAIETLTNVKIENPESIQVLFAGGIHDALSAAIVSVLAAPLSALGMKVGVLMGTAYLFTEEAVRSGAVVQTFQDQAIACRETTLLQSGVGIYTRCAKTDFCGEFENARRQLLLDGKSENEILLALEMLNIGRLRIASKGVAHNDKPAASDGGDRYVAVDGETQRREGMYMLGEVARLRSTALSIAELHNGVSVGATALLAKTEPKRRQQAKPEPQAEIAIVGMACLLPGAKDLRSYWQNIWLAINAIREVPEERWRPTDFFNPKRATADKVYSKWGGFLDDVAFDPARFGIAPASLSSIEPMQILSLYVASKALEDAGFDRRPFPRERTATIFAAGAMNELGTKYVFRTLLAHYLPKLEGISEDTRKQILGSLHDRELPRWTEDSFPGFLSNVIAGRVANRLDLRGANFTVDAACAASLAALDAGIRQLRSGDADVALVGAADGANGPVGYMAFAQTHALSPRGRCRPFDDSADGIVLGEGVAAVVLKRLADAERDGDKIYSVIKGIGSSSDGHNRSLTAPDPRGQVLAIERAYADAGVDMSSVSLIEAHGTGTPLGDKSEIKSLNLAFEAAGAARQSCAVGSVKSMIGHTKVTAGLAALIKASLALKHRVLPPTLGVEQPNHRVDFRQTPFYINTELRPWVGEPEGQPRRCGVSAFGFGGTNFHAVLEEYRGDYRATDGQNLSPRAAEIFAFGRANRAEVEKAVRSLLQDLAGPERLDLAQLAYSAHIDEAKVRPKNGGQVCQLAVVATSIADLKGKLEIFLREFPGKTAFKAPQGIYYRNQEHSQAGGAVCMLFPGQGSQHINMLRDLVLSRPSSYALFERADALLKTSLTQPLSRYVYPVPTFAEADHKRHQTELNDTRVAQPALGVVNLTAFDILSEFGLKPNFVAGHSYGEYVALCVAGGISRDDLIRLSEVRGRIAAQASGTQSMTMAAVNANESKVLEAIARRGLSVSVANLNAPDQTIIAGSVEAIEEAVKVLSHEAMRVKPLAVTAAFHCGAMASAGEALAVELAKVQFHQPQIPIFSNTTANRYPEEPSEIRALLARHIAEPLRFVDEIEQLYEAGARVFIEAGPGLVLSGLVDRILGSRPHTTLGLDVSERPGWLQLAHLLAQGFALGLPVNLEPWFERRGLVAMNVAQAFEQANAKAQPSAATWRVNGGRAEPWHAPASPTKSIAEPAAMARPEAKDVPPRVINRPVAEEGTAGPGPTPRSKTFVEIERRPVVRSHDPSSMVAGALPVARESEPLFTEAQGSISQLIALQSKQQDVLWRFIEFQENLLLGHRREAPAALSSAAPLAPSAGAFENPVKTVSPPAPVLPKLTVAPSANGFAPVPPQTRFTPSATTAAERPSAAPRSGSAKAGERGAPKELAPTQQFKADLMRAVVERTGYSEEMLDLDAKMEADLGIDSIKRIEIFSKLKDQYSFMEGQDEETVFEELAGLNTLNSVIDWYDGLRKSAAGQAGAASPKKAQTPSSLSSPETVESAKVKAKSGEAQRYTVTPVAAPRGDVTKMNGFPANYLILLVGNVPTVSAAFKDALTTMRYQVRQIVPGAETRVIDEDRIEVDYSSLDAVSKLRALVAASGQKVGAVFNLAGLGAADDSAEGSHLEYARQLFLLLKVLERDLRESVTAGGGWLINLTAFDGQFGLRRTRAFPAAPAGTLGVAKSVAREWPEVRVKCIDVDPKIEPGRLVADVLGEVGSSDSSMEVGFTQDERWRLDLEKDSATAGDLSTLALDAGGVLLVTGGAYGITADVARALAEKFRPRLVLVGRSPMPEDEAAATRDLRSPQELRQFLIRELRARNPKTTPVEVELAVKRILKDRLIRANISAMRAVGAQVEYHALDIRDGAAFGQLIDGIYARWGRIDGVLHGAGVIDDKLIRDKSPESFDTVFTTKVAPAIVLANKLRPENLKFLVFFSSIAGRFGNAGQCDYSAANEVVNKLANRLSHDWPHVHTVAINWGPWDGGMVSEELRNLLVSRDIHPIAIDDGRQCFLEELGRGNTGGSEIVVAANLPQITQLASRPSTI